MQERAALLSVERRQAILDRLASDGKVVAARLVEELGVSEDTVRRDLRELAGAGLVQRVHGGALPPAPPARLVHAPARDLHRGEGRRRTCRGRRPARRTRDRPRRLYDEPRAGPPAAGRQDVHRAHQLPADRRRPCRAPGRGGLDDRRTARQAGAGHGRRPGHRVPPGRSGPTRACWAFAPFTPRPASPPTTSRRRTSSARWSRLRRTSSRWRPPTSSRAASAYLVAPVTELTHVVAEAAAPDELLDPYRAIGVTVTRA